MFKNFLKIALRNILKYKIYSFINIAGLAIGLSCCILIFHYIRYEFSYDGFHKNINRIYRLANIDAEDMRKDEIGTLFSAPFAPALKNSFPEIEETVRINKGFEALISHKENKFYEKIMWVDPGFLSVFTFPILKGNPDGALNDLFSVVITERIANKYFGNENPIGRTLHYRDENEKQFDYTVSAIVRNVPENSHIQFDILAPFQNLKYVYGDWALTGWGNFSHFTYILLKDKNINTSELTDKFSIFMEKELGHIYQEWKEIPPKLILQPLTKIHLYSHSYFELSQNGDIKLIYLYAALGIIILIIACINFINLSTSKYSYRLNEISIRKVVGANRKQLITQYLGESLVITTFAVLLSLVITELTLPLFNLLTSRHIQIDWFGDYTTILSLILITITVGIVSGIYPALFLSSFSPLLLFKRFTPASDKKINVRKSLILFQFTASIVLITCTVIIHQQIHYIRSKNLGYNKDQIINIILREERIKRNYETLKNELLKNPNIIKVSGTNPPHNINEIRGGIDWEGKTEDVEIPMYCYRIDYDFLDVFEIELIEGRNFSRDFPADQYGYILNETAVKSIGWKTAIGKGFALGFQGKNTGHVIGVMKDFHFNSLHSKIAPLFLYLRKHAGGLSIKVKTENINQTLDFVKKTIDNQSPTYPFEYVFLDDEFEAMYRSEMDLAKVFNIFTALSILTACLGLYGLTSYSIERRNKEIGIRKVLGASVIQLVSMLNKNFIRWVLIANLFACPIAYYAMNKWLQNFAYRIDLAIWSFLLAGLAALVIALLTVSWQAIRAATANPVESLRYE